MLNIVTIVLNGLPYIEQHLPVFEQLGSRWRWHIAHGTSQNNDDQGWCQPQTPGLSTDGTTEYLASIADHPNVTVLEKLLWRSKTAMVNACLDRFDRPGVLMQVDSDELWQPWQLDRIVDMFEDDRRLGAMQFFCRYWLGKDIIATSKDGYGNRSSEWMRAWRYQPGMKFKTHEPPVLDVHGYLMNRYDTRAEGLVFEHYAWATEHQAQFKEAFYGYQFAVDHWTRLQQNEAWPVTDLRAFLPWVGPGASANRLSVESV